MIDIGGKKTAGTGLSSFIIFLTYLNGPPAAKPE
jgi:hypothetical protein